MNGTISPDRATSPAASGDASTNAPPTVNGHIDAEDARDSKKTLPSTEDADVDLPDAPAEDKGGEGEPVVTGDDDAASDAETQILSPVKRREAKKQNTLSKKENAQVSRIGGLPVPTEDDEDAESAASPMQSTERAGDVAHSDDDADMEDASGEDDSELLSSPRSSQDSSPSRDASEQPEQAHKNSANPLKRKHRSPSDSLPSSKRQSMDQPTTRRLRGAQADDTSGVERSPSPKRAHRRTISTQSALDGANDDNGRKRRGNNHTAGRESKTTKATWEESDASSEATSRGLDEQKHRPQRGVGRSTSTPGRALGQHKRHVNKYGFTRLAEACEAGDMELVKEWREKDPDQLELAEFAGNTPLQIAALNGNAEVVSYLIDQGCKIDCANVDKDTPLIDAAENEHYEVVKLLLDAGVDPLRTNRKGQQALDVIKDDTEDGPAMRAALYEAIDRWNSTEVKQRREEEEEERQRHRVGPSKEIHLMARTYENLLTLVQNNDRSAVGTFLEARVPVDNKLIAAAAKTGDIYLLMMLFAEITPKKASQKAEKPMLAVLGSSHFDMVKTLTEVEQFNPVWRNRQGKSWPELAEQLKGPMWRQEKELLQRLYDDAGGSSVKERSPSPVSKKEGKRRVLSKRQDDESDEDEDSAPTKKKNGRRLMSRKDMRAASGGSAGAVDGSDDEGEDFASDVDNVPPETKQDDEEVTSMKPPDTPTTRRRLRSKSNSSQPDPPISPKHSRTRSSSIRDKTLPTLEEEKEAEAEKAKKKKQREEEAKLAIEEAKRLEEQRQKEEAAAAEAKRAEEEAIRKAEEERKAEIARKAEEARKEEEERLRRERELEEKKHAYRTSILSSLPPALSRVFDPNSGFSYEGLAEKSWLIEHFTPLRILPTASLKDSWVLNIQAAALLGKSGLELFFGEEFVEYDSCLAAQWRTEETNDDDLRAVEQILSSLPGEESFDRRPDDEDEESLSHDDYLKRLVTQHNAVLACKNALRTKSQPSDTESGSKAVLRRIRLEDVMSNLHPLLKGWPIDIMRSHVQRHEPNTITKKEDADHQDVEMLDQDSTLPITEAGVAPAVQEPFISSTFAKMQQLFETGPLLRDVAADPGAANAGPGGLFGPMGGVNGDVSADGNGKERFCGGVTECVVVHEK